VLEGELDLGAGQLIPAAQHAVGHGGEAGFVFDLAGISFIDVAGLEVIFEMQEACGQPLPVRLRAVSEPVVRLIRLLQLEPHVQTVDA
jgi:anti-anti-sigma regulatory factor